MVGSRGNEPACWTWVVFSCGSLQRQQLGQGGLGCSFSLLLLISSKLAALRWGGLWFSPTLLLWTGVMTSFLLASQRIRIS